MCVSVKKTINYRGITIMEVAVAIGIFSLLVLSVVAVFSYSLKSNKIIWEQLSTQNEGRKAIQDIINELRRATYSSIGAYPLVTVNTTTVIFYSNIDSDSLRERVRYFLSGKTLRKGVIKPTGDPLVYNPANETLIDIAHDVSNTSTPVFSYYGQNYGYTSSTPLNQPVSITDVRMVGIKLNLEEDPSASPAPFNIESKVEIRNLKTN